MFNRSGSRSVGLHRLRQPWRTRDVGPTGLQRCRPYGAEVEWKEIKRGLSEIRNAIRGANVA
jgi:hypothetical protein